jgi:hypothetical protein
MWCERISDSGRPAVGLRAARASLGTCAVLVSEPLLMPDVTQGTRHEFRHECRGSARRLTHWVPMLLEGKTIRRQFAIAQTRPDRSRTGLIVGEPQSKSLRSGRHGRMGPTSPRLPARYSTAPTVPSGRGGGEALRLRIAVRRNEGQHVRPSRIDLALHVLGPVGEKVNHVCKPAVAVGTSSEACALRSPSPTLGSAGVLASNPCTRRKSSNASLTRDSNCSRVVLSEVRTCTVAQSPVLGRSGHTSIERRHRARLHLGSSAIHATLNR